MPDLGSDQFKDYRFRAYSDKDRTLSVVSRVNSYGPETPLGSMAITRDSDRSTLRNDAQVGMNRSGSSHGWDEEANGQQRWVGGNMEPNRPDRVSWLALDKDAPRTLLKGMMALGVARHGSVPAADYELSQYGAKISQGAARKYGVKGHPSNPEMSKSFTYGDGDNEYDESARNEAEEQTHVMAKLHFDLSQGNTPLVDRHGMQTWQTLSAAQVGHITRGVEADLGLHQRQRPIKGQEKLF